tara:strand:+ start:543 stop:854 length:312 start_codon:yes stop_codon:yes gene_type:complete
MSLVTAFVASMHAQAAPMIGQETITIGATSISCTLAEIGDSKDFGNGGFEKTKTLTAVCLTTALPATEIIKKAATARGEAFRVEGISRGAVFSTITLEQVTKA